MNDADSVFSDDNYSRSYDNASINLNNDHMAFLKQADLMKNANPTFNKKNNPIPNKQKPQVIEDNGYESQFSPLSFNNPSAPVSSNNVGHINGNRSGVAKLEMERELALKGNYSQFDQDNMTYNILDEKNLTHNNMVPYFKKKTGMGYAHDSIQSQKVNSVNQRKMELFSGSSKSVDYRPKTERRPLFNPIVGAGKWIYGQPNSTAYMETRFIPGKEQRNVKPFLETRVTPGLAKGYNEISKEGFNETYRALPKDTNELRTADNPKVSYGSVIVPGMKGQRRGVVANMAKHTPPKFKEQDPRDMLKSLTYYRAPSIYGNVEESVPITNRASTSREYFGPVAFSKDEAKPESMMEQYRTPNKENYLSPTPRNTTAVDKEKTITNTANSYYAKQTKRITTQNNTYVNPARPEYAKGHAYDMVTNRPDPTKRNATEQNGYIGVATAADWKKQYLYDRTNAIPDATNRNTTENNGYVGHANPEYNKGYVYDIENFTPDPTKRNATENTAYVGNANPEYNKGYIYDSVNFTPDPTKRNATENTAYVGNAVPEWKKQYLIDYENATPDPTKRNATENTTHIGNAVPEWKKQYLFDSVNAVPDPTKRNTTEVTTHIGNAVPEWKKQYLFDSVNATPDPTKRNTTEVTTHIGNAGPEWKKQYLFDSANAVPDPTKRNATEVTTHIGNAGPEWKKQYLFDSANAVPDPTKRNATEVTTHIGNAGPEWKKQYLFDSANAVPDPTKRNATEVTTHIGNAGPQWKKLYAIDYANATPDPTKRNATENTGYIGVAGPEWKKQYAIDYANATPDPTKRNATEVTTHIGGAGPQWKKLYAIDYANAAPDPTKRNATEKTAYIGTAGTEWKKQYAIDYANATPDPTKRNATENNTNIIGVFGVNKEKGGYQVEVQTTVAKPTLRQLTENTTHINPSIFHEGLKTRVREDANNSLVDIAKEQVATIRDQGEPTTCNYNIGPIYDYTMTQACEPIQINRDVYGSAPWKNPLNCVPTAYTRAPSDIPHQDFRLDTCILSGLDTNVFVNNTQHKYVAY